MQHPAGQAFAVLLPLLAAVLRIWEKSGGESEVAKVAEKVACECLCVYSEEAGDATGFLWGLLVGCALTGFACKQWFKGSEISEEVEEPAGLAPPLPVRVEGVRTPSRRDVCSSPARA